MKEIDIDVEKDCLFLYRDSNGIFSHFEWYVPEMLNRIDKDVVSAIESWNNEQKQKEDGKTVELVQDKTIREICAYIKRTKSIAYLSDNVDEAIGDIDSALNLINSVEIDLRQIKNKLRELKCR